MASRVAHLLAHQAATTIEDTWYTTGLRGTGSNDYVANDLFVPYEHSFSFREPKRAGTLWTRADALLRKMSGVPLARGDSIDRAIAMLENKSDRLTGDSVPRHGEVTPPIGDAEALPGAARATCSHRCETQWAKLERAQVTRKERADTVWRVSSRSRAAAA